MIVGRAFAVGCTMALLCTACSVERGGTGSDVESTGGSHAGGEAGVGGQAVAGGAGTSVGGSDGSGGAVDDGGAGGSSGGGGMVASGGSAGDGGSGGSVQDSGSGGGVADDGASAACSAFPNARAFTPPDGAGVHCYWLGPNSISWPDARTSCQGDGGDLATLTSQAENDWVTSTLVSTLPQDSAVWIGLTDKEPLHSTVLTSPYVWISGETSAYTNWAATQPDHWYGPCGAAICCQHRGAMGIDGSWFDRAETDLYDSLCEGVP